MTKAKLQKLLNNNCEVTFIKKNGEERKGIFKINPDHEYSTDAIAVIEVTTGQYRAFKASSVIKVKELA